MKIRRPPHPRRLPASGFTLLELLLVMAVILVLGSIAMANFKMAMVRAKLQGDAAAVSNAIQRARSAAIRQSKTVVAEIDPTARELVFFYDEFSDDGGTVGENLIQNKDDEDVMLPLPLSTGRSTQGTVRFWAAGDNTPDPAKAMDGFTTRTSDSEHVLVIERDGSVRELGGIRIGMGPDAPPTLFDANFMEIRVVIAATGRTELRKFIPTEDRENTSDPAYQPRLKRSDGTPNWKFY